jgi:hypothetical protein
MGSAKRRKRDAWYEGSGKTYSTPAKLIELGPTVAEVNDLEMYFTGYAPQIGFRSSYGAIVAAECGVSIGAGTPANWDPYAGCVREITQGKRIYRRLKRMIDAGQSLYVTVLHLLHGDRQPGEERSAFGELAALAELTDAVAEVRVLVARRRGEARESEVAANGEKAKRAHRSKAGNEAARARRRALLIQEELRCARDGRRELSKEEIKRLETPAYLEYVKGLEAELVEWQDAEARAGLAANDVLDDLREKLSALSAADKETTTSEAVDYALRYRGPKDEKGKPDPKAYESWRIARDVWIERVKREAGQLRIAAWNAYRAAREEK